MERRTSALYIEKIDIVGRCVDHGPKCHRISDLSVEPDVLVSGKEPGELWADDANDVSQHGDENHAAVECQNEASAARNPHGPSQSVEGSEFGVGGLQGLNLGTTRRPVHAPGCASHNQRAQNGFRRR